MRYDPSGRASTYNSGKAAKYANGWAKINNPRYYQYENDCANFVSQCLWHGGLKMDDQWYSFRKNRPLPLLPAAQLIAMLFHNNSSYDWDVSRTWRSAQDLAQYLTDKEYATQFDLHGPDDIPKAIEAGAKLGDPMFYNDEASTPIDHAMIITLIDKGDIFYSAHSISRDR